MPDSLFFAGLRSTFEDLDNERDVLVYIHGYWTSFEDAVVRAAQIGFDLKVRGVTALFSWPSRDSLAAYFMDGAAIEASEPYLEEFLLRLVEESGAAQIHVIAHSMGNLGLLRAIGKVADRLEPRQLKFGQIFLAAPDVDRDLFVRLAGIYPTISTRTTMYASSKDAALAASSILRDFPRAGFYPPVTVVPPIDTILVSAIDMSILGHGYFAEAATVLYDMFSLLRQDTRPADRLRLSPATSTAPYYWEMTR